MKDIDFLFIVALIVFFFFGSNVIPTPDNSYKGNLLLAEGMVAMACNDGVFAEEDTNIVPVPLCTCNGTGKVRSPDGLTDITCPCNDKCECAKPSGPDNKNRECRCGKPNCQCTAKGIKCQCPQQEFGNIPITDVFEKEPIEMMDEQILYFHAKWCVPCKRFDREVKPKLIAGKWGMNLDKNSYIKPIDIDEYPELAEKYEIEMVPTFIMLHKGKVVAKLTGYSTLEQISQLFYEHRLK